MQHNNYDYGIIGNCRTAALVSKEASIDWLCLPNFSSASVFAGILDEEKGGAFRIKPVCKKGECQTEQEYIAHTNILKTVFTGTDWSFTVYDFMPRYKQEIFNYSYPPEIVRIIADVKGAPKVRIIFDPRLNYGETQTELKDNGDHIKAISNGSKYESVYLYSNIASKDILKQKPVSLKQDVFFILSYNQKVFHTEINKVWLEFERTRVYWLDWVDRTITTEVYAEQVVRSALVLKLLTYQNSGAILAAVTTSLPETIGGVRNWDYRFCWLRDSSMIISVMTRLGHRNIAERFINFILRVISYKDEKIQIMYGIHGEKKLTEFELPWLSGYLGSQPVRVGNAAYKQKQNDIYGLLMDIIYKYLTLYRHEKYHAEELWTVIRSLARTVEKNWKKPDAGIWEFRQQKRHIVFSKVLCWVAMDRGVSIAALLNKPEYEERWKEIRDTIHKDIMKNGWNPEVGAFTQSYDSEDLDASNLLMGFNGCIDPHDEKYINTVLKTKEKLSHNGLMFRYTNGDDFGMPETSFTICTFWLIKALVLINRKDEAISMLNNVLGYTNHLGLLSEGIDFITKRLLGNFPQGYSHLALIDLILTINEGAAPEDELTKNIIEKG